MLLQHQHLPASLGQDRCCRQASNSRANDDGVQVRGDLCCRVGLLQHLIALLLVPLVRSARESLISSKLLNLILEPSPPWLPFVLLERVYSPRAGEVCHVDEVEGGQEDGGAEREEERRNEEEEGRADHLGSFLLSCCEGQGLLGGGGGGGGFVSVKESRLIV